MRLDGHLIARHEVGVDVGFVAKDVQPRCRELAAFQRVNQRGFVHDRAARGVDQVCAGLHDCEFGVRDQVRRFGVQWAGDGDDVGRGQERVQRRAVFDVVLLLEFRGEAASVVVFELHVEYNGLFGGVLGTPALGQHGLK